MRQKTFADLAIYAGLGMIFLGLLTVAFGAFSAAITADFGGWPSRVAGGGLKLCFCGLPVFLIATLCGGNP